MENKQWYTLNEASYYLRRCSKQVTRYIKEGRLKGYQTGFRSRWFFDRKDLDAFVIANNWYSNLDRMQKKQVDSIK